MLTDETTFVPSTKTEQPLRPLKFSEAMRIGAAMRPQCFGTLFKDGGSCGIGAAWEGFGGDPSERAGGLACRMLGANIAVRVARLNDHDRWTREQIADWLESKGL